MKKTTKTTELNILKAANELLLKQKITELNLREIVKKAGVNVAMVSYYFGSKEQLFLALYRYRISLFQPQFSEFFSTISHGTAIFQIRECIRYSVSLVLGLKDFQAYIQLGKINSSLETDVWLPFLELLHQTTDQIMRKGVVEGVFQYAIKPEDLVSMLVGGSQFIMSQKNYYEHFVGYQQDNFRKSEENKFVASFTNWVLMALRP